MIAADGPQESRGYRQWMVLALFGWALIACAQHDEPSEKTESEGASISVAEALSGEQAATGYARALGPRPFLFPDDHGAHPDYRHEWWYVTGNVEDSTGRHFGFQVTFFRFAVAPESTPRASAWATRQLWMAHFAVTDTEQGAFHHFERLTRGALGLAGAESDPFRVWLEAWQLSAVDGDFDRLHAEVAADGVALDLRFEQLKPLIFQGEGGYSRKGPEPGNASYYYTAPRLAVDGEITLGDKIHRVSGSAWLDREWGSSTLGEGQLGWDWFSLQFDDGRELMFYHLRRADGSIDPLSQGGWVDRDGVYRVVTLDDIEIEVVDKWQSPDGAATYPARWRLSYPQEGLELEIEPRVADQELRGGFRYWEGAIYGRGTADGEPITAVGYAELTGYDH